MPAIQSKAENAKDKLILFIGFCFALLGYLNALPDLGPLPSLGVTPAVILHPVALAVGFTISALLLSKFSSEKFELIKTLFHLGLVIAGLYALISYNIAVTEVEEVGLFFFEEYHAYTTILGCVIIVYFCARIWGLPLATVGGSGLIYFFFGEHLPGILGHAGMDFVQDTPTELWYNTGDGVMGNIMAILLNTVFPFIILGAVLQGTGGGNSMIKLSFHAMRRFRGGPAHAAIMASSLFGTISGSAVSNVVGTGVISIPMIKKRGFSPSFAGGVEATASTGGQIMPPIMGAAALVMADFLGIDYLTIIIAAIVPALAYYLSLFVTVIFEARALNMNASDAEDLEPIVIQDWINLVLVVLPIATVVFALVSGFSAAGSAMLALSLLMVLSFINPDIRKKPLIVVESFAKGGVTFGRLLMAIGTIGIIIAVLGSTGLPLEFAKVVNANASDSLLVALVFAALASLALGMGMPTLPAYLTIIVILGPALTTLGLSNLTAHFFVFYFGVASAITPPVAMAAFAAAAVAGGGAISTAAAATRIGVVIFAIPFLFAFNPEMLIVSEAGGEATLLGFGYLILRLLAMVYLLASATSRFDLTRLSLFEVGARLAIGLALIHPELTVNGSALLLGACIIGYHAITARAKTVST